MEYSEAIKYLMSFTDMERGYQASPNPTMSLESVHSLLARLNNPERGRHTVHITGSKGKGSTATMIEGVLRQAGLTTALYTSPHLHEFTERIQVGGEAVTQAAFAAAIEAIRPAIEAERESVQGNVSTFGILTALFFWLVHAQAPRIEWQVVEVGLGGTYDATNVFEAPDVTVITPISLEHTKILGNTPGEIAKDKAGIIKAGSTCVLALQRDPEVVEVVRARCAQVGAELIDVGSLYSAKMREHFVYGQSFVVSGPEGQRELRTPLLGAHQVQNAATAVAVIDALRRRGHTISEKALEDGLARARIRGRLEVMGQKPLIVADGAHNGESAEMLADALRNYFTWKRCYLVLGTLADKDVRAMGFKLARLCELIICCRVDNPRSMDPGAMIQEVGFLGPMAVSEDSVADALDTALARAKEDDIVCVTGSLYTVAEARTIVLGEGR